MKLEEQVCSLKLSKKLRELGVKQESLWWWVNHWDSYIEDRNWNIFPKDEDDKVNEHISAFTVAELGEMLPDFPTRKDNGQWLVTYDAHIISLENTEANARAKMLVYLKEKGGYK